MKEHLPEKLQDSIMSKLLGRPENQICADCHAKGPRWVSLDFGVFICLNCSGQHRNLGPHITRVRSVKLDKWTVEFAQIMDGVGNKPANAYYEFRMPANYLRPSSDDGSDVDTRKSFINEKYIKKRFAPEGTIDPVTAFLKGTPVEPPKPRTPESKSATVVVDLLDFDERAPSKRSGGGGDNLLEGGDHTGLRRKSSRSAGNLLDLTHNAPHQIEKSAEPRMQHQQPAKRDAFNFIKAPRAEEVKVDILPAPALVTVQSAPAPAQASAKTNIMGLYGVDFNAPAPTPESKSTDGPKPNVPKRDYSYLESLGSYHQPVMQQPPGYYYPQQPQQQGYPGMMNHYGPTHLQMGYPQPPSAGYKYQ
eukprot:TRINITY_DN7450_c0_g1_i1.p1 TRINITY_DN7450_c0_g1~~TRINITY_DN7450_c0_g1_i1.p1  ORF type:complete len:362 (-),score=61.67 TRINITY_DN7450_c0_g1_i1:154-1239(-)